MVLCWYEWPADYAFQSYVESYINALANNGFVIERLVEETDKERARMPDNDFGRKAQMLPTAIVLKVRKT